MKKKLIGLAVALALSGGAHAWDVEGVRLLDAGSLQAEIAGVADPAVAGKVVADRYREAGFLSIEVKVDPVAGVVRVVEAGVRPVGGYAAYFAAGEVLTADAVKLASARMGTAARLNGERVTVSVRPVGEDGFAEVAAEGVPAEGARMRGGNLIFSTLGQRYSGPDVLTGYGWMNLGNAQQIDVSASHAFSDWREDSKDGRFNNVTLGYRKATHLGLSSVQVMHSKYKTGGPAALLDVGGSISRLNLEHAYLFNPRLTGTARLSWVENEQEIGKLGWTDRQRFSSLTLSGRYTGAGPGYGYVIEGGVEQGLGGSRSISDYPLMGQFDPKFTVGSVRAEFSRRFESGWGFTAKAGRQVGTKGTPSASQFYLGGPDRGRSYNTGYSAMPSGFYSSFSVSAPAINGVVPYLGLDYARGKPVVGDTRVARSAFVGLSHRVSDQVSIDLNYARALGRLDDPSGDRARWGLTASVSF